MRPIYSFIAITLLNFAATLHAAESSSPDPAAATKTTPYVVAALGMEFVPVSTPGIGTDAPRIVVLFSRWETRLKDWQAFVDSKDPSVPSGAGLLPGFTQTPDQPAMNLSKHDADLFTAWLNRTHPAPAGWRFDLPTDDEWSAAVGPAPYPWGTHFPPDGIADGNYSPARIDGTSAVGLCGSNQWAYRQFGVCDLGGNLWEWTKSPLGGDPRKITLRGAAWCNAREEYLRSSYRTGRAATCRDGDLGFRCVLRR
jgi:formylglycine-generating enzyme required for sulfatase activity